MTATRGPAVEAVPSARFAPGFGLVRAHFGLAILGLVAFAAALLARSDAVRGHYFQPLLLGLAHLCVLGWLLPVAFGALHQLLPVILEVPVRSERLAWVALPVYVLGALGFIGHLWTFAIGWGLPLCAALVALAVWLYAANLLLTIARAPEVPLAGLYVISALLWLSFATALGLALAWNLHDPFLWVDHVRWLRAHVHAAAFGFFGLLILGVAPRLLSMFLVSYGAPETAGRVALAAIDAALVAIVVHFLFGEVEALARAAQALAILGGAAFALQLRAIWVRRMRRRLDPALGLSLAAFLYLALAVAMGMALAAGLAPPALRERLEVAYGLLALPGFVGTIVTGQLYKIGPFLVWLHRFSKHVGLRPVPGASELLAEGPQRAQAALMHLGLLALTAGVLADAPGLRLAGAALFAASALLVARNLVAVDRCRPQGG